MLANPHLAAFLVHADARARPVTTMRANQHDVREVQRRFLFDDARLDLLASGLLCPAVPLDDVDLFDDNPVLFGDNPDNRSPPP